MSGNGSKSNQTLIRAIVVVAIVVLVAIVVVVLYDPDKNQAEHIAAIVGIASLVILNLLTLKVSGEVSVKADAALRQSTRNAETLDRVHQKVAPENHDARHPSDE